LVHAVAPALVPYVFTGQAVHVEPATEKVPAEQTVHPVAPTVDDKPALQLEHRLLPEIAAYKPATQLLHPKL
jgi:hypothetical protein